MSSNKTQRDMFPSDSNDDTPRPSWMGLIMNHRRLFSALESGWLSPLPSQGGVLLSMGAYIREREESVTGNPICVGIQLDVQKLPDLDVQILCGKKWKSSRLSKIESAGQVVYWPGVLPTFAISELRVSTEEKRVHIEGFAQQISNVDFSSISIGVDTVPEQNIGCDTPANKKTTEITVPSDVDATHGALSMAVWAIPSVDPWMDLLTVSLVAGHTKKLNSAVRKVGAGWWKYPPWQKHTMKDHKPSDLQECFWLAAIEVFRKQSTEKYVRTQELAEQIANSVLSFKQTNKQKKIEKEATSKWLQDTISILRAETVLQINDWREHPVEMIIQMVLTRSEPVKFKTWFKDMPDLPPVIGWSAAVLCGLFQGYRKLDSQFRGGPIQRELLSIYALRMCSPVASDMEWPSYDAENIQWRKDTNKFMLLWGDKEFKIRGVKERAAWYAADFEDDEVQSQAQSVAKKLGWSCIIKNIHLEDSKLSFSGTGDIKAPATKTDRHLVVKGEVLLQLPENYSIEQTLDTEEFRQLVVVERGILDPPPNPKGYNTQDKSTDIAGLVYIPDFITEGEEKELLERIDNGEWLENKNTKMTRRVQHYGWKYDYKARQIDASMRIGDLPPWALELARKLHSEGLVKIVPDQVIVNEYVGNQGISKHVDSSSFAEDIATISLLESWEMIFRKGKENKHERLLEQRSVAVMSRDARHNWTHEIPKRKTERGSKNKRERRISLTFRKVIDP